LATDREAPCLSAVSAALLRPVSRAGRAVAKGDEIVNHSVQAATTQVGECTLRAWDDMLCEVLHELSDGADVPDALVESMSQLAVTLKHRRRAKEPTAAPKTS